MNKTLHAHICSSVYDIIISGKLCKFFFSALCHAIIINKIFFSSHITSDIQKIADYVILIHRGKIIFEEQKDNLVYNYGVSKCGKEKFAQLSSDDYIIHRTTNMSVECLVREGSVQKEI